MNDDRLDDLVRAADPARRTALDLRGAHLALLEEIVATPREETTVRSLRHRVVSGIAVAATITAFVGGAAYLNRDREEAPVRVLPSPSDRTSASPEQQIRYTSAVIKAAQENPRMLVDLPGWKATDVYGFAGPEGSITYSDGTRALSFDWYPADQYDTYHRDRLNVSRAEAVEVDGQRGDMIHYSAHDYAVMLPPDGKHFVELRTSIPFDGTAIFMGNEESEQEYAAKFAAAWTGKAAFLEVLTHVKKAGVEDWLASLPAEIVTPERTGAVADAMLADIPLPPGFDKAALGKAGTNDRYQFGAAVTGRVACGWIEEWQRAQKAGDRAAVDAAVKALASSRQWKVLQEMNPKGDYPEAIWAYAADVAAGREPAGFRGGLGCP